MSFKELIPMKKSNKNPKEGDVFVVQPKTNMFIFGKVIKTKIESNDSFINGMSLIYIYNKFSDTISECSGLEDAELLIPPIIVNNQPWKKGYFQTIAYNCVTQQELDIDYGFWDLLKKEYVDIKGNVLRNAPKYCSEYGLGSYGVVGKNLQAILNNK